MKCLLLLLFSTWITFSVVAQPANDDPCNAVPLTVGTSCTFATYTNASATASTGVPAPGCSIYSGGDVWFRATVPVNGHLKFDMNTGTITDSGMAIYSGTCGSLTLIECDDDDSANGAMSMISRTGLTPGSTIYIRVWEYGGDNNGTFQICASNNPAPMNSCGSFATNDNCPSPAILTQGSGTFSATTDVTFTADLPGNVNSIFCGSIENNSWYQFTATSTTHTFPITSVFNCTSTAGIQAQVYNVTYNASGCCTNFASVSNCYNPGSLTLGTVTATGLTIGNQYLLMIDGNAGAGCDFTISGWTATGILPVELSEFSGRSVDQGNILEWTTESEYKNDYFEVMYSRDADHFVKIGEVQGAGISSHQSSYTFVHQGVPEGTSFYQLRQVNFDGDRSESKIISIQTKNELNGLFTAYPNPVKDELIIELQSKKEEAMILSLIDDQGRTLLYETISTNEGITQLYRDYSFLKSGVYTLIVTSKNSSQKQRIIKN